MSFIPSVAQFNIKFYDSQHMTKVKLGYKLTSFVMNPSINLKEKEYIRGQFGNLEKSMTNLLRWGLRHCGGAILNDRRQSMKRQKDGSHGMERNL